eukprot:SAG31_NODE_30255_length_383_cov_1.095070_1_plen_45_part_10
MKLQGLAKIFVLDSCALRTGTQSGPVIRIEIGQQINDDVRKCVGG